MVTMHDIRGHAERAFNLYYMKYLDMSDILLPNVPFPTVTMIFVFNEQIQLNHYKANVYTNLAIIGSFLSTMLAVWQLQFVLMKKKYNNR